MPWSVAASPQQSREISVEEKNELVARGRYLAGIGVCSACHTAPNIRSAPTTDPADLARDRVFRTDADWFKYLDPENSNYLGGGVPFILRLGQNLSGLVVSTNITPDPVDGIGSWSEIEIADTIRMGRRPDRALTNAKVDRPYLYLFPPHSFFRNLSRIDALALAYYLKSVPARRNSVPIPLRQLPDGFEPDENSNPWGPVSLLDTAPQGRGRERALYLTSSLVGCRECHSQHSNDPHLVAFAPEHQEHMKVFQAGPQAIREFKRTREWDPAEPFLGPLIQFAGGGRGDPYEGVFRLGPDLPLRVADRGVSLFPYPGYAVLYGGNLTRFGHNGPLSHVPAADIVRAMRQGISTQSDEYGRPRPLSQVMMWPFYSSMTDDDAFSIAEYIKSLDHVPNSVERITLYGEDWAGMFQQIFGEVPNDHDREIFGKPAAP